MQYKYYELFEYKNPEFKFIDRKLNKERLFGAALDYAVVSECNFRQ